MNLQVTPVFSKLKNHYESGQWRQIVAMGGSRSSKSWSILQLFIMILLSRRNFYITVWRNTAKTCRGTVRKDFKNILASDRYLYNAFTENKTEATFTSKTTGSTIVFEGADDIGKVLGLAQDISFFNEVTEFNEDVYLQITQRTAETVFADYNPSKNFWFERFRKDDRTIFDHSTYRDNPFCPPEIVAQLNSYDPSVPRNVEAGTANQYMYDVYCEGIRAEKPNKIYHGWREIPDDFFEKIPADSYYALDFGLSSPNALVEIKFDGARTFFVKELLYLPSTELKRSLSETIDILYPHIKEQSAILICDSAKKTVIDNLILDGFYAVGAIKGGGSVDAGISFLQACEVCYTHGSRNIAIEEESYSFDTDKYGKTIDKPEAGQADHLMDAIRYGATYLKHLLGIELHNNVKK